MSINNPKEDVCNFLSYYASRIWYDMMAVHKGVFRLNEVTITQNLVREFLIHAKMTPLPISIYESINECANGNDLEILAETSDGYILIPTQVKVIKQGFKYPTMSHVVGGSQQISLLIDYARKKRGIPAYMFYNYCDESDFHDYVEQWFPSIPVDSFGCTIGNAYDICNSFYERNGLKKWTIPSFGQIHLAEHAVPLVSAFARLIYGNYQAVKSFAGKNNQKEMQQVRLYSYNEIRKDEFWTQILPPARISGLPDMPGMGDPFDYIVEEPKKVHRIKISEPSDLFNPKYRIVISENFRGGLFSIS